MLRCRSDEEDPSFIQQQHAHAEMISHDFLLKAEVPADDFDNAPEWQASANLPVRVSCSELGCIMLQCTDVNEWADKRVEHNAASSLFQLRFDTGTRTSL
jgi:hypothetical protein